ncbi:MAG: ribonuclease HII, partial [Planctomycetes bacterium]|nr:ribonuclease HII [Planctomycetota bacterium]
MLVYAGIDEAGYGPMLGPLCLGCTVFVLKDYDPCQGAPDL